jgi:hypothetical protein
VLREVVVNDQHIPARFHEELRDAGGGVRGDVRETRRVVALAHHQNGVVQRTLLPQGGHGLRDGGRALADGAIDAHHILVALVEYGVHRNGRLARLAVAENQLALAAPNGNQRIDDCETSLQRDSDWRAVHNGRGWAFDRQALAGGHWPAAIERPPERVDRRAPAIHRPRPHPSPGPCAELHLPRGAGSIRPAERRQSRLRPR